jgi:hypothetical protein
LWEERTWRDWIDVIRPLPARSFSLLVKCPTPTSSGLQGPEHRRK